MTKALRRLQRWFAAATTGVRPPAPGSRIGTGGALDAAARLAIHRFAYRERLLGVLANDHAGVRRLLGERRFRALALAYVADCPSDHPNLNQLGRRFPGWLARTARPVPHRAFVVALARLEAALAAAFDADERQPLPPDALAAVPPAHHAALRLELHPSVQLLAHRVPIDAWFDAHRAGRRTRPPAPRRTWTLVHRLGHAVHRVPLAAREYALLRSIAAGEPLAGALRRTRAGDPVAAWFARWAAAGLFTGWRRDRRAAPPRAPGRARRTPRPT